MNKELMEALDILEKEKNISKDTLLGAIEQSLIQACKNHFGKADNVHVTINPETCDFSVYAEREVKEFVDDPALEISLVDAQKINTNAELGDMIKVEIHSKEFGRIATQNAKNVILQKIREEERKVLYDQYYGMEKEVVTGIVQRVMGKNVSVTSPQQPTSEIIIRIPANVNSFLPPRSLIYRRSAPFRGRSSALRW